MKKILLKSLISACLFFSIQTVSAQNSKQPEWVRLMDNPNTNYFEAVDSFKKYWSTRMRPYEPNEPEEEREEKDQRSFLKKIFQSEEKAAAQSLEFVVEYKRFKQWQRDMLPFVQEDGSLVPEAERWKIIQSQIQNAQ